MSKRRLVVFTLALAFLGCAKRELALSKTSPSAGVERQSHDASASIAPVATPSASMMIRTATLQLIVADVPTVMKQVAAAAAARGGHIANSREWRNDRYVHGSVVARVPAAQLEAFLADVRGKARRVDSEEIGGEDVSQEYVDLGARLRNLEATEEELRQLLSVVRQRTQKAADILSVHSELSRIRGEIEQVKGRRQYLDQMTSFSTVTITLTPDAATLPVSDAGWQPLGVARNAVTALVSTAQLIASLLIWLAIYVLPLATLAGLVMIAARRIVRRSRAEGI